MRIAADLLHTPDQGGLDGSTYEPSHHSVSHTLSVHYEACRHLHRTVQTIKDAGVRASVGLNPASPISLLHDILPDLDMVLLMSVNPGFGGQAFIPATLDKIRALKQELLTRQLSIPIEVDGGIKPENACHVCDAGADILVAGTAIFGQPDYAVAIRGIPVKRDISYHQSLSAIADWRLRARGNSSIWDNTVSNRSGNSRRKNREAGVDPSEARQSKLCRALHT